jgi:phage terminase large subunit
VIWFYQVVAGEIHVIDYYASSLKDVAFYACHIIGREVTIDFIANEIVVTLGEPIEGLERRAAYRYAKHWLPHDAKAKTLATNKSVIEQLVAALGPGACGIVPSLDMQDGIQAVRLTLPRCWFDRERTDDGLEALKQYQREWDEERKVFKDKPRHDWTSHAADAFRMLAIAWRGETVTTMAERPKFEAIADGKGGMQVAPLDTLWKTTPRSSGRI